MTALPKGRENMKGRIISARTAKPNSEKQVLQRVTQIHMMFSRTAFSWEGEVCIDYLAKGYSDFYSQPTPQ